MKEGKTVTLQINPIKKQGSDTGGFGENVHRMYGLNPKTGEAVALAGKNVPHFKPGKDLRERVNESRHLPVRN